MEGLLLIIYQMFWDSGEVPADWKLDNIIPIFEQGMKKDLEIIRHSQHEFTKGKSCLTNLISCYDMVIHLVNECKEVDVAFLDLSKASDTFPHSILLDRLSNCEMNRYTLCWL